MNQAQASRPSSFAQRAEAEPRASRVGREERVGRGARAGLAAAVAGVLAVAALVVNADRAQHPRASAGRPGGRANANSASAAAPHPASSLRLASGSRLVDGLYLGYPDSTAGAVSAAVEFSTELGSTLDPARAATIARLAAYPSYAGAPDDAARGAASTRRRLGLPVTGPLPPGTGVFLVPVMYQVRDFTAGQMTVLLLFTYTAVVPAGIQEHLGATEVGLRWTGTDWRLLKPGSSQLSGLIATPGTAGAAAKGWEAMTGAM